MAMEARRVQTFKSVSGVIGAVFCPSFIAPVSFTTSSMSADRWRMPRRSAWAPTLLGLGIVGLCFCVPLIYVKIVRLVSLARVRPDPARTHRRATMAPKPKRRIRPLYGRGAPRKPSPTLRLHPPHVKAAGRRDPPASATRSGEDPAWRKRKGDRTNSLFCSIAFQISSSAAVRSRLAAVFASISASGRSRLLIE